MATQIQLRRDLASNWTSNNPTLAAGEFGWESDTNKFKIGTGSLAWNSLGYASGGDNAGITFVGDDSTGTLVNQNETFKIAGTQNITAVVSGDTLTLTGPDLSSYLTSVSESDVTQHQAALSITESQISDLQNYKTAVSESDVTQHQAALSITESQISDLSHFSGAYADLTGKPTIPTNNTELTNGAGYITASSTDTLTNKSGNISQFTNDSGYKTSVSEADVTQHQAALSITESQISDLSHFSGSYTDLTNKPTIPTNNNQLTNGAGYATTSYVDQEVAGIVDTAPEALNTLNELAAALGDDANFATTTSTALGNRLRVDTAAQGLTTTQKTNAKTNLGLSTVASTGAYSDLSGTPTIPSNNNELTNGAGYITASSTDTLTNKSGNISQFTNDSGYLTSFTETNDLTSAVTWANVPDANITQSSVTQHQAALSITESQISDLGSYITDANITIVGDDSTGTSFSAKNNDNIKITGTQNLSVAVSGDTITVTGPDLSSYSTFSGSYTDLTNKPTIPSNNTELTNGAGYITASSTDTLTNKSGNISQFTNDSGYKTSVSQSDVTQHQAALSITESQVSDLGSYITASSTDTLTNKTFNANGTGNSISNLEVADFATGIVDTDFTSVSAADNTLASAKAIKSYVDTQDGNIASDTLTFTNKSGNISQWTNDSGYSTFSGSYTDLTNKPTIPTNNNELTNGAGYITASSLTGLASESYVNTQIANTVDSAPEALNTLNELAAALGDDANFATTTSTALGNRLRVDTAAQGLTSTQKSNAKTNLGLSTVATSGAYGDLSGLPTIPTNNNQLTNGAGYLTSVAFADVTSKPTTIAGYGITDAFDGAYSSLSGTPTIPSALTDLSITDGSNGQVLTTDGAGNFTFTTVSGGGSAITVQDEGSSLATAATTLNFVGSGVTASGTGATKTITIAGGGAANTGDITFNGNELSTGSSNADLELTANGTGGITISPRGQLGDYEYEGWDTAAFRQSRGAGLANLYGFKTGHAPDQRAYQLNSMYVKLDGTDTSSGEARFRNMVTATVDYNGGDSTNTSSSRGVQTQLYAYALNTDSTSTSNIGNVRGINMFAGVGNEGLSSVGNINVTNLTGAGVSWEAGVGTETINVTNATALKVEGYTYGDYNGGTATVANQKGIQISMSNAPTTSSIGLEINNYANTSSTTGEVYDIKTTNYNSRNLIGNMLIGLKSGTGNTRQIQPLGDNDLEISTTNSGSIDLLPGDGLGNNSTNDTNSTVYADRFRHREAFFTLGNKSGTWTPDINKGNVQEVTLTGNSTINSIQNIERGQSLTLIITQDGTGGRTLTMGSSFKFAGGVNTLSTAANAIDVMSIFYTGSTYIASLSTNFI